jgi:hypothetical protein
MLTPEKVQEVLESSILADDVLSLKILALRMLTSGGSPGGQHPCWTCALSKYPSSYKAYLWRVWSCALSQDPSSKNAYLWKKSWRAASLLVMCSLSRSWLL